MTGEARADRTGGVNPALVRAYDLRGVVGRELTESDAHALGLRVAAAASGAVAVGFDGRLSSPALEAALVDGLMAGGAAVRRVGRGPIGLLYHAVHAGGAGNGVMVTGSHNPPDQNGFKLVLGGEPVFGDALRRLVEAEAEAREAPGGRCETRDVADAYAERLLRAAGGCGAPRIGWDPGNGATGELVRRLTARLPGEHRLINTAIDGRFPAHHPDPSVPANLRQLADLVRGEGLDLGIAFDGDGDRIGVVDGEGVVVWADQLLLLLAKDVLRDRPGAPIVGDVKSSRVLFDGIAVAGGRALVSPSGYVLVRAAMVKHGAPLAGEMSGHIFYADDWNGTDDALHVAMRLLRALGRREGSLADFRRGLPETFATLELRLPCPDAQKAAVLAQVEAMLDPEAVDRTDGLRVTTPGGWWLLRASGTEPKLTARVEGWTAAARDALTEELFARLRAAGLPIA